jgi:HSP20 family molecular chaperone IbpA
MEIRPPLLARITTFSKEMIFMLMSGLFGEDLFDEFLGLPTRELANIDRQLYGKHAQNLMKTDVHENETDYEMDMDLPGFKKDQIKINLENGYLTISAAKEHDSEKKKHGKVIRQERYEGSMQRSFYVGDGVKVEDVKARFEDGVLKLCIPKKELKELPSNTTIAIEG